MFANILSCYIYEIDRVKRYDWLQGELKRRRIILEDVAQEEAALDNMEEEVHWYVSMYILHHKLMLV